MWYEDLSGDALKKMRERISLNIESVLYPQASEQSVVLYGDEALKEKFLKRFPKAFDWEELSRLQKENWGFPITVNAAK